jgi:signal transduction histidine kinase
MGAHMLPGRERWRAMRRSIRFTMIAILAVPVLALVVVGAFAGLAISTHSRAVRSDPVLTRIALADAIGLAAILLAAVLMGWFARRLTRDLSSLEASARRFADQQLPQLVERLRRGENVDPETELSPSARVKVTEAARAAAALASLQRTALAAAVTETSLRSGISQVFVSLARRSQSLLQRQLRLLDDLEHKAVDPGALADLFPLDHLTTRMRRHAEGLIILSGAAPGRAWSSPVPVIDVIRGAIAEVEDYKRIAVVTTSDDMVAGSAVADTIHLLAELIENATLFSPSGTRVEVQAELVGNGFAFEVEDRGLGIKPEELDAINLRLSSPADFDLANADQLGLFVVGKLAARHGIRVFLRPSPYGGTTAIVLLPHSMITSEAEAPAATPPAEGQVTAPDFGDLQLALTGRPPRRTSPEADAVPGQPGALPIRKRALPRRPGARGLPGLRGASRSQPDAHHGPADTGGAPADDNHGRADTRPAETDPGHGPADVGPGQPRTSPEPADTSPSLPALFLSQPTFLSRPVFPGQPGTKADQPGTKADQPGTKADRPVPGLPGQPGTPPGPPGADQPAASADQPILPRRSGGSPGAGTYRGLPRRVRQANLSPHLRSSPSSRTAADPHDPETRSPEQARSLLASLQSGWERGRQAEVRDSAATAGGQETAGRVREAPQEEA